ncbi:phage tail tape measure protein [Achromobacter denitrificans]
MTDEVASLVLRVDSTQAKTADTALDQLAVTSQKTEQAVEELAKAEKQLAVNTKEAGAAAQTATVANKALGVAATGASMSAGQLNNAMRMLPAQITDITVGLSTGQSPFTVLLQQGGQLKDMFGGIGPAVRAVVGYVGALVTPVSAVAAAVAALGFAYYTGSEETDRFNKAIILTGNAAGVTADQLAVMSQRIGATVGTTGKAAGALAQLVESGQFAGDTLEQLATAAVQMEEVTGRSVEETVKHYRKIAEDPAKAIAELNRQQNFLTASQYEQIQALEREGNKREAARVAVLAYADASRQSASTITERAGAIERAWDAVWRSVRRAGSAIADIGRDTGLQGELAAAEARLAQLQDDAFTRGAARRVAQVEEQRKVVEDLRDRVRMQQRLAAGERQQSQITQASIDAQQYLAGIREKSLNNQQKQTKALEEYRKQVEAIRRADPNSNLLDPAKIAADEAAIRKQFEDRGASGGGTVATGVRQLQLAREREAVLRAELETAVKLTSDRQKLVAFEQRIADLKAKDQLTAEEKSVLANEAMQRKQLEINAGLSDQIELQKEAVQLKTLEASAQATLAADQQRYNDQLQGFTAGPRLREQLQAQQQIYRDFQREVRRASEQEGLTPGALAARVEVLKKSLEERLAVQDDYYNQLEVLESDWENGAIGGLNDYSEEAANVAAGTRSAFADAFKGAEDALVQFVTTGKLNFSDLANSIIADLARIAIRQNITGPLASALGQALSGWMGGGGAPTAGQVAGATQGVNAGLPLSLASGGYTGDKPRDQATGIVHGQEYVLNADTTARLGRGTLDALNAGGPLPMSDTRSGAVTPVTTGTATQGGTAPKVQINLVNQSGEQMEAQQGGARWDTGMEAWVCDVVLSRARKDRGFRRQLQEPA